MSHTNSSPNLKKAVSFTLHSIETLPGKKIKVNATYSFRDKLTSNRDILFRIREHRAIYDDEENESDFNVLLSLLENGVERLEKHVYMCFRTKKLDSITIKTLPMCSSSNRVRSLTDEDLKELGYSDIQISILNWWYKDDVFERDLDRWEWEKVAGIIDGPFDHLLQARMLMEEGRCIFLSYDAHKRPIYYSVMTPPFPRCPEPFIAVHIPDGTSFRNWVIVA